MLERLRAGAQGPIAKVIIGLIIFSFVLAGVGTYLIKNNELDAAIVDGNKISLQMLERQYQIDTDNMKQRFGEELFAQLANNPIYLKQIRQNSLRSLVAEALIQQEAKQLQLTVGNDQIKKAIKANSDFYNEDGQFDNDRYLTILSQSGLTPSKFNKLIRESLIKQQFTQSVIGSEFALPKEVQKQYQLQEQTRDGRYAIIPIAAFNKKIAITNSKLEYFYSNNKQLFQSPEQVAIEYIKLDLEYITAAQQISSQEIENYYQDHIALYTQPEIRKIAHILVEFSDNKKQDKAKAERILAKLNNNADFAVLAKKESDDWFTKDKGGELPMLQRGIYDTAFEQAAYSLSLSKLLSPVIAGPDGYHIIKLLKLTAAKIQPLDEVKEGIKRSLIYDKAISGYHELASNLEELAFQLPDSLIDVADQLKLTVKNTELFSRKNAPEVLTSPSILNKAFSEDLISSQLNSDIINISDTSLIVLRVTDHKPSQTQPFKQIKEQVKIKFTAKKSQQLAMNFANKIKQKLTKGEAIKTILADQSIDFSVMKKVKRSDTKPDANIIKQLFNMPRMATKPDVIVNQLTDTQIAIIELTAIKVPEFTDDELVAKIADYILRSRSSLVYNALLEELTAAADIDYIDNS